MTPCRLRRFFPLLSRHWARSTPRRLTGGCLRPNADGRAKSLVLCLGTVNLLAERQDRTIVCVMHDRSSSHSMTKPTTGLTAGLSGSTGHGCAAITDGNDILGVCEQERVTRVRAAGFNTTGCPDEALDLLLSRAQRDRNSIRQYVFAGDIAAPVAPNVSQIDRHLAHAYVSYLSSSFTSATIVVCDHASPKVSIWKGTACEVLPVEWPWTGAGFSDLYSKCAQVMNLRAAGDQRFEALARLEPDHKEASLDDLFQTDGTTLSLEQGWESRVADWVPAGGSSTGVPGRAAHAAALQRRIAELLLVLLAKVRDLSQSDSLCLGGDLFYHSSINSLVRTSGLFSRVFVPVDPGEAGRAVGVALRECDRKPKALSPFLGPAYTQHEVKSTLDNCKIPYTALTESEAIETAVIALRRGQLVGWYEGAMEWGQRALGARSILANPFATYVLENLNRFLKQREPWRGYALSVSKSA